ncbi:uncharacterized protein LOC122925703 isoform X1 [Bufo gargarizans]|uniref:uncharacterized protein LOC122925703 isoform X1 n=1 Tax=Bufo gargarizans TaxID=30331 RepID=UPI001CF2B23C|nr:uncharacterized protein LOC122925703 isoform X1 [Bufo gargarizans]
MEIDYSTLKRSTLKDLLEARGISASNKTKATLISEIMAEIRTEDDSVTAQRDETDGTEQAEFQRHLLFRLSFYGENPPVEIISKTMTEVQEFITRQRRPQTPSPAVSMVQEGKPKIPYQAFKMYVEAEEDIDAFLQDFERLCTLHKIHMEDWVPILAGRLTGRAAEAYRTIPDTEIRNYSRVKEVILARYAMTPEAYRRRFRELKKAEKDSHAEWACRLQRAALGWVQANQAQSMEDLLQMLLLEQFYDGIPADLQEWVRDRNPTSITEAAKKADDYMDARRQHKLVGVKPAVRPLGGNQFSASTNTPLRPLPPPAPTAAQPRFRPPSSVQCHQCQRWGHYKRKCPELRDRSTWIRPGPPPRAAAHHYQEETPTAYGSAVPVTTIEQWEVLHEANPLQAQADNRQHHRQTVYLEGKPLQGLRDSGATITLVQSHLVADKAKTNKTVAVRVAGGAVYRLNTARVHLHWGAGSGTVEVGLMPQLPAEVILGNDLGKLTSAFEPQTTTTEEAHPVVTRQQARTQDYNTLPEVQTLLCLDWGQC